MKICSEETKNLNELSMQYRKSGFVLVARRQELLRKLRTTKKEQHRYNLRMRISALDELVHETYSTAAYLNNYYKKKA